MRSRAGRYMPTGMIEKFHCHIAIHFIFFLSIDFESSSPFFQRVLTLKLIILTSFLISLVFFTLHILLHFYPLFGCIDMIGESNLLFLRIGIVDFISI